MDDYRNEYPIGVEPRYLWDEQRYSDVMGAIKRYVEAGLPVDPLWVEEYNELHKRIDERQSGSAIHR